MYDPLANIMCVRCDKREPGLGHAMCYECLVEIDTPKPPPGPRKLCAQPPRKIGYIGPRK